MTLKDLEVENEITKKLPQYIRQYENFFKFMKMLSNYILKSKEYAEKILELENIDLMTGDVLVLIGKKLNVLYDKVFNEDGTVNYEKYYNNLKTGIYGVQTKRLSNGTLYELKDTLIRLFPNIEEIKVTDNLDMTVSLRIVGDLDILDTKTIEEYILPRITGVKYNITYIPYGKNLFAFDRDVEAGSINPETGEEYLYGEKGWDEGEWSPVTTIN